jgi:tRNA(Arg) A34 adenosine deaminase TadA
LALSSSICPVRSLCSPWSHSITDEFLDAAIAEAEKGRAAGGIPIGSVLVIDGRIVGRGHNQRV